MHLIYLGGTPKCRNLCYPSTNWNITEGLARRAFGLGLDVTRDPNTNALRYEAFFQGTMKFSDELGNRSAWVIAYVPVSFGVAEPEEHAKFYLPETYIDNVSLASRFNFAKVVSSSNDIIKSDTDNVEAESESLFMVRSKKFSNAKRNATDMAFGSVDELTRFQDQVEAKSNRMLTLGLIIPSRLTLTKRISISLRMVLWI